MKKALTQKKLIVAIAGLLLLTFCIPASSQAAGVILVPAAGLAIWGVTIVAGGISALFNKDDKKTEETQAKQEPMEKHQASDLAPLPGNPNPLPNEG